MTVPGRGHYVQMRRSSARQGMSARFQSTRILLTESCLSFYYNIKGPGANITVQAISEVGAFWCIKSRIESRSEASFTEKLAKPAPG